MKNIIVIRWDKQINHIDHVAKDVNDINITRGKITNRFENITNVEDLELQNINGKLK